jgi:hypothetical protein
MQANRFATEVVEGSRAKGIVDLSAHVAPQSIAAVTQSNRS